MGDSGVPNPKNLLRSVEEARKKKEIYNKQRDLGRLNRLIEGVQRASNLGYTCLEIGNLPKNVEFARKFCNENPEYTYYTSWWKGSLKVCWDPNASRSTKSFDYRSETEFGRWFQDDIYA